MIALAIFLLVSSAAMAAPTVERQPAIENVAPGVYAVIGAMDAPFPENRGHTGNQGFIVGEDGVIVIDSGSSSGHGRQILEAIRKVTSKPVLLLINTHAGPDHVLGNSAFRRLGIPILSHRDADRFMAERCETCLKNLTALLGKQTMEATEVARPNVLIDNTLSLTVGGRLLDILYFGHAHAPGEIAVLDRASGVLFAGDLVYVERLPELREASIKNWISALEEIKTLPVTSIVPGHGPISVLARAVECQRYLEGLLARVEQSYREGKSILEAAEAAAMPSYRAWALYDTQHTVNVHHLYLELEREELER